MQNTVAMKVNQNDAWTVIRQPDSSLQYAFETTFASDSNRVQIGDLKVTPLYTVEQLGYEAGRISVAEMRTILRFVAKGYPFYLRYFSPYTGTWVTNRQFYVGKGDLAIGSLDENCEYYDSLAFNMTSVKGIQ